MRALLLIGITTLAGACRSAWPDLPRMPMPPEIEARVFQLVDTQRREVPVFVNEGLAGFDGLTHSRNDVPQFVEVRPAAEDELRFTLAHECVHFFLGEGWGALPYVVEDGLCDRVAADLSPEAARRKLELYSEWLAAAFELAPEPLSADWAQWGRRELHDSPPEHGVAAYALGYRIAHEVAPERLHALSTRAQDEGLDRVPEEWLLDELPHAGDPELSARERALRLLRDWDATREAFDALRLR